MNNPLTSLIKYIDGFVTKGHQRSVKAKKNIFASFLIKGTSIFIGFYMVPLTIGYVAKEQYGVWLTLSSVVGWFSFFDIGLGNGLRNKLAVALAENDMERAKTYVSSTYAILSFIISGIMLIFFVLQPFLDWQGILNTKEIGAEELRLVAIATFSFFCINFLLKIIHSIFFAYQKPALQGLFNLFGNILALIVVFVLTKTTQGSLLYLSLALGLAPMLVLIVVSLIMFQGDFRAIAPSLAYIKKDQFSELWGLGGRFFIVQISFIIIYSTDNLIITQLLGPQEVPAYSVAHKYFGLITAVFAIISAPFWSAYTEAYTKKDVDWILSTNRKLIKAWAGLVLLSLLMLVGSSYFYKFWVPEIEVPVLLSIIMCIYVNVLTWGNIFVVFINGVGKIQLQLIIGIVSMVINIPLSYFFASTLGLESAGVILASIISVAYGPILAPIQFKKIINGTATGLWNK
ncbi:O-antigen/teichoic acid export membrane protein [Flavobacteriaceae bacterium MAR_2009_75]|nr:O-antigen/teichoic acid export membrane protein [Flavobacteriaceae bacterium MAR_2009_75]